jgi:pimeloyl-ACP methyl ester carboxylesterase
LPAVTVRIPGADGLTIAAEAVGPDEGPAALLIHGGGQTRHAWGTTLRALGTAGWRALSMDLRGHGESDWSPDGQYRLDDFAADVAAVARSLGTPVLVGASLGGLASLVVIGEQDPDAPPVASGLVLVDVAPRVEVAGRERIGAFMMGNIEEGFASLEEVADAIAAYNPHRPRPTDLSGLKKNLRQRPDGRWAWHWDPVFITGKMGSADETRSSIIDPDRLSAAAAKVTVPVLLVRGRMSDLLSEEGAQELLELVPHAALVDVAGAGHMVAGDRNDLFNDAVVSFLDTIRG